MVKSKDSKLSHPATKIKSQHGAVTRLKLLDKSTSNKLQPIRVQPTRSTKKQMIDQVEEKIIDPEAAFKILEKRIFKDREEQLRERLEKKLEIIKNKIESNKSDLVNYKSEMFWNYGDPRIKKVASSITTNSTEISTIVSTTAANEITAASTSSASKASTNRTSPNRTRRIR